MTDPNRKSAAPSWIVLGGAQGGTVLAAAIAPDEPQTAFAATEIGVFRTQFNRADNSWERLVDLPGAVTALAVSRAFARDRTLVIGTTAGPMVSFDGGGTFQMGALPRTSTHVVAVALSPEFERDGIAFAGTLEDGVLVSHDHGRNWMAWNFGLIELETVSLALSPNFADDETILMGTVSGVYYSYNGGRAWRELDFPSEALPVLSLAFSPKVSTRVSVFAGTETAGLFLATDPFAQRDQVAPTVIPSNGSMPGSLMGTMQTEQWQSLSGALDAVCINALAFDDDGTSLYVATEKGIFVAHGDRRWETVANVPGALCLALTDTIGIAGVGYRGEPEISGLTVSTLATAAPE